jgi:hypothetical protein
VICIIREGGDVTIRVNARDENENNNTGLGGIRIQVASKSARAPLAGSDRYRYGPVPVYTHSCTGTGTIMIDSLHPLFCTVELGGTELGTLQTCARGPRARARATRAIRLSPSQLF